MFSGVSQGGRHRLMFARCTRGAPLQSWSACSGLAVRAFASWCALLGGQALSIGKTVTPQIHRSKHTSSSSDGVIGQSLDTGCCGDFVCDSISGRDDTPDARRPRYMCLSTPGDLGGDESSPLSASIHSFYVLRHVERHACLPAWRTLPRVVHVGASRVCRVGASMLMGVTDASASSDL